MPDRLRIGIVGDGKLARAVGTLAAAESVEVETLPSRIVRNWRPDGIDVVLDCAAPTVVGEVIDFCAEHVLPVVECVSGLDASLLERFAGLGAKATVVLAPNLTLGNYLQHRALREIIRVLDAMRRSGVDAMPEASVLERHPSGKRDRPSATARMLAASWESIGQVGDVASVRAGGPVSDHTIALCWPDQQLSLAHSVSSLQAAAAGALGLAGWARTGPQGVHRAHDVFDELVSDREDEQQPEGTAP
jgi:4-hydroxy-tetrahydrodipicolinate reductase